MDFQIQLVAMKNSLLSSVFNTLNTTNTFLENNYPKTD